MVEILGRNGVFDIGCLYSALLDSCHKILDKPTLLAGQDDQLTMQLGGRYDLTAHKRDHRHALYIWP